MKITKESEISELSVRDLQQAARFRQTETLDLLRRLVEIESPSADKAAVDRCMQLAAEAGRETGGKVRWHRQKMYGDVLEVRFPAERGAAAPKTTPAAPRAFGHCLACGGSGEDAVQDQERPDIWAGSVGYEGWRGNGALGVATSQRAPRVDTTGSSSAEQRGRDRKPRLASDH